MVAPGASVRIRRCAILSSLSSAGRYQFRPLRARTLVLGAKCLHSCIDELMACTCKTGHGALPLDQTLNWGHSHRRIHACDAECPSHRCCGNAKG